MIIFSKLWERYKKQLLVTKLNNLFRNSTRQSRRQQGFRWPHKETKSKKLTRSQKKKLATMKIEPPQFTNYNVKKTRRHIHSWSKRMAEARRKKANG